MFNYNQSQYVSPYQRNYGMPNYTQPQYQMAQPQVAQQPQMQPQQPIQQEMPIQYVGYATIKEAEGYILFPNSKAIFIDKANGMVYEKVCGQDGQSFITHFKRVDDKGENQAVETQKEQPTIDLSSYAKKDDLGEFASVKQVDELREMIVQLKEQLNRKTAMATKQVKES